MAYITQSLNFSTVFIQFYFTLFFVAIVSE